MAKDTACITCLKDMCICIENTIEKQRFSIHDYCLFNNKNILFIIKRVRRV